MAASKGSKGVEEAPCQANADNAQASQEKLMAEHIRSLADMSYRTELNKDASLKHYAGNLLTCITILSAAYLMPAQVLWELFGTGPESDGWHCCVCLAYCLLLVPLLVAIVITLLGCCLKGSTVLDSPMAQFAYFSNVLNQGAGQPLSQMEIARSYCDALEREYGAMEKKHKTMWACLQLGTVLSVISCCIAIACIAFLVPAVI